MTQCGQSRNLTYMYLSIITRMLVRFRDDKQRKPWKCKRKSNHVSADCSLRSRCAPRHVNTGSMLRHTGLKTGEPIFRPEIPNRFSASFFGVLIIPNSNWLVMSRFDATRHVRRVECAETSVSRRVVRRARHSRNAWARHVERVVSCQDVT